MRSTLHMGRQPAIAVSIAQWRIRSVAWLFLPVSLLGSALCARVMAQSSVPTPMQLTLDQAIDLALKQNHSVHLRSLAVEQMQSKKDEEK